jgi:putative addiction module killer protein
MTAIIRVVEYVREDGSCPYRRWFESLDVQAAAKVDTAMYRLRAGNTSNVKWFAGIGERIIDWGAGYRVYLVQEGASLILLLGGGTKRTQSADIARALELRREYKSRKAQRRREPTTVAETRSTRSTDG